MAHYDDLKKAIETTVFVSTSSGRPIINGNERRRIDWIFDFRALLLQPQWLDRYAEIFWEKYATQYPFQVSGMETAAIALVAAIVMKGVERGTPVNGVYIRKSRKRQGLLKQIEGTLNGEKVILVDDLINSGSTFDKQAKILADAGAAVSDIFALVAFRERPAYDYLKARVQSIFTLEDFGLPLERTATSDEVAIDPFETLWRFKAQDPLRNFVHEKSTPALDENRLYFGTDAGVFYAIDQATGCVDWEFKVNQGSGMEAIFSSPLLYKGMVYFGANDGSLYALDQATGSLRWSHAGADSIGSSPTVSAADDLIFIGLEFGLPGSAGGIAALDARTGTEQWTALLPGSSHSSPLHIKEEKIVVIGDDAGNICAYASLTGKIVWSYNARSGVFGGFAYDETRRIVYFGTIDGICYGLFASTGDPVFVTSARFGIYSTPLIQGDTLYVSSLDKKLYAIDIDSAQERWIFTTKGRIFGSPAMADGSLWIGSNDGKLYELDPRSGKLRSTFQASERIINRITYNDKTKRFFVPTQANEIYCLTRIRAEADK